MCVSNHPTNQPLPGSMQNCADLTLEEYDTNDGPVTRPLTAGTVLDSHNLQAKKRRTFPVGISGVVRTSTREIKYLGVMVHDHLSWLPHFKYVTSKAQRVTNAVVCMMRNHSGPKSAKRRIIASVEDSILRYAAPVWHTATESPQCSRLLEAAEKIYAIMVASSFRSVSYEATVILSSTIPICLLVNARCYQRLQSSGGPLASNEVRADECLTTGVGLSIVASPTPWSSGKVVKELKTRREATMAAVREVSPGTSSPKVRTDN